MSELTKLIDENTNDLNLIFNKLSTFLNVESVSLDEINLEFIKLYDFYMVLNAYLETFTTTLIYTIGLTSVQMINDILTIIRDLPQTVLDRDLDLISDISGQLELMVETVDIVNSLVVSNDESEDSISLEASDLDSFEIIRSIV